jgi:hypothetical protein
MKSIVREGYTVLDAEAAGAVTGSRANMGRGGTLACITADGLEGDPVAPLAGRDHEEAGEAEGASRSARRQTQMVARQPGRWVGSQFWAGRSLEPDQVCVRAKWRREAVGPVLGSGRSRRQCCCQGVEG